MKFNIEEVRFLRDNEVGRLATISKNGLPHVVPVCYIYRSESLWIATEYSIPCMGDENAPTKAQPNENKDTVVSRVIRRLTLTNKIRQLTFLALRMKDKTIPVWVSSILPSYLEF